MATADESVMCTGQTGWMQGWPHGVVLDAMINEDVLRQGFNMIGGGGPTFFLLTSSYAIP